MLVTSLCWWLYDGDWFEMLVAESLCWRLFSLCWWFSQCIKSVTNILNRSPISQTCHQHIWSPTSVTNIDATEFLFDCQCCWQLNFDKKVYQLVLLAQDGPKNKSSVLSSYDSLVRRASIEIDSSYWPIHTGLRSNNSSTLALWQWADNLPVSSPSKFHPKTHGQVRNLFISLPGNISLTLLSWSIFWSSDDAFADFVNMDAPADSAYLSSTSAVM